MGLTATIPSRASPTRSREIAGSPVALERPGDPEHGDYATNVALQLAGLQRRAAARDRRGDRREASRRGLVERAEAAGPGVRQPLASPTHGSRDGVGEIVAAGAEFGVGLRGGARADPGRDGLRQPDRARSPSPAPGTARTATPSHGSSRSPGTTSSASTTTTTPGAQMERFHASVEAVRRGEEPPEDGYRGDYIARARGARRRSGAGDAASGSRRRSSASASTSTPGRARARSRREIPEAVALLDTYEEEGAVWARTSAHGDDKDRVLVRSDGAPTYFAKDAAYIRRKYAGGLRPARSTSSAPTTTATSPGCRRSPRCSATRASRSRCSSTSSSTSSRAARRRRCRSGAATSSSSTSSSTRSAWTPRAGTSSRAATTRRSSSTSTSRKERTQKNPVYYVQYAHARIAGILRNADGSEPATGSGPTTARSPPRSASS